MLHSLIDEPFELCVNLHLDIMIYSICFIIHFIYLFIIYKIYASTHIVAVQLSLPSFLHMQCIRRSRDTQIAAGLKKEKVTCLPEVVVYFSQPKVEPASTDTWGPAGAGHVSLLPAIPRALHRGQHAASQAQGIVLGLGEPQHFCWTCNLHHSPGFAWRIPAHPRAPSIPKALHLKEPAAGSAPGR